MHQRFYRQCVADFGEWGKWAVFGAGEKWKTPEQIGAGSGTQSASESRRVHASPGADRGRKEKQDHNQSGPDRSRTRPMANGSRDRDAPQLLPLTESKLPAATAYSFASKSPLATIPGTFTIAALDTVPE